MNLEKKLAILHLHRGICRYTIFTDSGIGAFDFKTKDTIDYLNEFLSDLIGEDFNQMYNNKLMATISKEFAEIWESFGTWWHIGDIITQIIGDFCAGDDNIDEENLKLIEQKILKIYRLYKKIEGLYKKEEV